ncbi:MAG TPA: hypothetical protein VGS41_15395, partial [Chthonomonadales bacterium]|nr:hypothetical protein [Chthonomonadales bacterium]
MIPFARAGLLGFPAVTTGVNALPTREILVPQMGEGLTEVRVLDLQKKPGDSVERDEIIYSM